MLFSASLDRLTKGITIAITILFAFITAVQVNLFLAGQQALSILLFLVLFSTYLFCYVYRITAYELTNDQLIIHRPFKNKFIPVSLIWKAELPEKNALRWVIRTFGNGGLWGFYGQFSNTKIGGMTWYASRRSNMLMLHMKDGKKIVITPDEPEQFLNALSLNMVEGKPALQP